MRSRTLTHRRPTSHRTITLRIATGLTSIALGVVVFGIVGGAAPAGPVEEGSVLGQTVLANSPESFEFATTEDVETQMFVDWINELRAESGAGPLLIDPELALTATAWTTRLAQTQELSHADDLSLGVRSDWRKLGENVGVAPDGQFDELFEAFVASPTHLSNMIDTSFDMIGIGVVHRDGKVWMTQRFMDAAPADVGVELG